MSCGDTLSVVLARLPPGTWRFPILLREDRQTQGAFPQELWVTRDWKAMLEPAGETE